MAKATQTTKKTTVRIKPAGTSGKHCPTCRCGAKTSTNTRK